MRRPALVCDTSLLLYLGRIGHEALLNSLFEPVYVPEPVNIELAMGRLLRPDTIDPAPLGWIALTTVSPSDVEKLPSNRLGFGERAVLAYAYTHSGCWAGLDDRQARLLAVSLGVKVVGTVGIIIRAKRTGLIPSARELLGRIREEGFHLSTEVYVEALRLAGEERAAEI